MIQYFKEILTTFSTAQRIWALIILCISVFFITFGSDIIDAITPDPEQQSLIVRRQRNVIVSLNTQLDSLTLRVDDLTQKVIDGQSDCSNKRIQREKEIIVQIDEIMNMVKSGKRQNLTIRDEGTGSSNPKSTSDTVRIVHSELNIDNSEKIIKGLCDLKSKIKNKK
jgi:hypothetical protein